MCLLPEWTFSFPINTDSEKQIKAQKQEEGGSRSNYITLVVARALHMQP